MSYEKYKDYRLAPDDNGCWDVLSKDYEQLSTYPSKSAAKRAIDEMVSQTVVTNPTTPEYKIDAILYLFEQRSNKAREQTSTGIPLTNRLVKEKREARTALLALLNEVRGEEFSHYWREFERHHIWDSSEIVDVLTKRNISNAATPKEE